MNFDELRSALKCALETGRIGQPVAVRLHLRVGTGRATPEQLLVGLAPVVADVFGDSHQRVLARSNADFGQVSLLLEYDSGATALTTVVALGDAAPCLQVILIGNHGVMRLEGGTDFELSELQADAGRLLELVQQSLACGEPVNAG